MRVLLVKTSSMGDIIHTLPALTDAKKALADIQFDWLVEENFAHIAHWHQAVDQVFPVALRRWRKALVKTWRSGEYCQIRQAVRQNHYDLVLDAQGLFKSAWLSRWVDAPRAGLDKHSAREPIASYFYQQAYAVDKNQHAVERTRSLFAQALGYDKPDTQGDYALPDFADSALQKAAYIMFLHGTTWPSKHWPEDYWRDLAQYYNRLQQSIYLPWGNEAEKPRAERIAKDLLYVKVLPKLSLDELVPYLANAKACVAVDTGLGHLTAALNTPCVSLYGPTLPEKVGTYGQYQQHLCATGAYAGSGDKHQLCLDSLKPESVIDALNRIMDRY